MITPSKLIPRRIKEPIKDSPQLRKKLYPYYARYLRVHLTLITWLTVSRKYNAKITPFDIIHVDPNEIKYCSENPINTTKSLIPRVMGGDWDQKRTLFKDRDVYKACKAKFQDGDNWSDTKRYKDMEKSFTKNKCVGGVSSPEEREKYFKNLETLYEEIKEKGYLSQTEIPSNKKEFRVHRKFVVDRYLGEYNEVQINIGRNGDYLFHDGRHRLSIAKLADIEKIPVRIFIRHQKWQQKRDNVKINSNLTSKKQKTHPDLVETL